MRRLAVLCGVLLLVAPGLLQAATTSRLMGTVVDNDNKALPGVTVTLASPVLIGGPQIQITDANGSFAFNLLPPGQYEVKTELPGFVSAEVSARVALDRSTEVQIQMVLQDFADQIEVTAEAPVVDTAQVNSGDSYNEEFLKNAAVGMGGRDYLSVIGNAAGSVGTGNVNVMGSVSSDNVYLIDGLNTTDPITATFGTNFNYDAIQEVSIQTSGFEAEFGQALGGVVNLVTKSGGNEFSGSFDARYRDQSFAESGTHYDPNLNPGSLREISATLGGPIMRDKLWFFTSVGNTLSKSTPQLSPGTREFKGTDWIAKLTWQVSDAHRAIFKMSGDPAKIPFANAGRYIAREAGGEQDQGGRIYQAELNSVLSDSWLLTLQAGLNRQYLNYYPMSGLNIPGYVDLDYPGTGATGLTFINETNAQYSDRDSDQYKGSVSYFADNLLGSHEFKGGIEYRKLKFNGNNYKPGGEYYDVYEYYNVFPDTGTGRTDFDGDGYTDYQMHRDLPGAQQRTESTGDFWTYYLQDSWRPIPNLTFKPGVRLDTAKYDNRLGEQIADFSSWQPRFGAAWDFLGTGKSVVRANLGRFMHPGSVNLSDTVNGRSQGELIYNGLEYLCFGRPLGTGTCTREYWTQHALDQQEVITVDAEGHEHYWYLYQNSGVDPFQTPDTLGTGHLKPAYVDSISLAFEQQLWAETSLSLEIVNKRTKSLLEDTCNNNTWVFGGGGTPGDFDDPSTWTSAANCTGYVISNPAGERRDYRAFIAEFESRYKGLHIMANYTYAKSKGNSEAEANRSYATEYYDFFPLDFYNLNGYLSDDRRHRIKLNGYLLLPLDFTVGFDYFWSSEPALDVLAVCTRVNADVVAAGGYDPRVVAFCANNGSSATTGFFLEPRGSRRGKSNDQLDLGITKAFKVKSVSLEVTASILNVLSSEHVTAYQTQEFLAFTDPSLPNYNPDNVYGAPLAWQQPRRYEVGFRVEF